MLKKEVKIDWKKQIKEKVSDSEIFEHYLDHFTLSTNIHSPFRKDSQPSFRIFEDENGDLWYKDYGDEKYKGDVFMFVQQLFNLDFTQALKKIKKDFNVDTRKKIDKTKMPPKTPLKVYSEFEVEGRFFERKDLAYWSQFGIQKGDLEGGDYKIFPLKELLINKKRIRFLKSELAFVYHFKIIDRYKIYFPERNNFKWFSNVPLDYMVGLTNINKDHTTFITKSLKDYIVCKKLYPFTCATQNESIAAFSIKNLDYIKQNSLNILWGGDGDKAGKKIAEEIRRKLGFKPLLPPDFYSNRGYKDWAEMQRVGARREIKKLIKNHVY